MSVTSIIFSKDRPAQLDLLLRSMKQNAPGLTEHVLVIARSADEKFREGYATALFETEGLVKGGTLFPKNGVEEDFHHIVTSMLERPRSEHVAFFVDDDVIYRPLPVANPSVWLDLFPETLAFSLRLGRNTGRCYPMNCAQASPPRITLGDFDVWRWLPGEFDMGYPMSLDGGVFRRDDLLALLDGETFTNPNQLEEALVRASHRHLGEKVHLAAFKQSVLVGIPANSVSETHRSNRHSETFFAEPQSLNTRYLEGKRLSLRHVEAFADQIDAAHVEVPLLWEDEL